MAGDVTRSAMLAPLLPRKLLHQGVGLRPAMPDDDAFLRRLYASTRWPEVATWGWPEPEALAFLNQQFDLQQRDFAHRYPEAAWLVVTEGRAPIGRLCLGAASHEGVPDEAAWAVHIIDISLMPSHRGHGIGGALIRAVQDLARSVGSAVSLSVDPANPARRLYCRLGFEPIGTPDGVRQRMAWRSAPAARAAATSGS
jgi:ribosomal protein S18 acetylase RimI-like enzyme